MNAVNYLGIAYNRENPSLNENTLKSPKLFCDFVSDYLAKCHRNDNYKSLYRNTINHILKFCELNNLPQPYTNTVDAEFCEEFVYYLQSHCNHMQNTVKGQMERLHAMLQKACNYGYPINNTFREVNVSDEEVGTVYLNVTEITRIYYFTGLNKKQEEVRDLFVIGCLTGLRYSDYSRLGENNFINNYSQIRIKTRKTGAVIQVPAHRFVRELLAKYEYCLPKRRCLQYFNVVIKQVCKKIGLTEPVPYERTVGRGGVRKMNEKWEVISSHTARRSFATNMFLQGLPPLSIMMITGHKSETAFFRYVRVSREQNALSLMNHPFFQ